MLTVELRPLYATLFAGSSLAHKINLRLKAWGSTNERECWLNTRYFSCMEACPYVWTGKGCACKEGAFRRCEDISSLKRHSWVPDFVRNELGLMVKHPDLPYGDDYNFWVEGRSAGYEFQSKYVSDNSERDSGNKAAFYFTMLFLSLALVVFLAQNLFFLCKVGPYQPLNGTYVRFCLELEQHQSFRNLLIGYAVTMVVVASSGLVYATSVSDSGPPNQGDLIDLFFLFTSAWSMLAVWDLNPSLAIEDEGFDEVQFKFLPLFFYGVNVAMDDLTLAKLEEHVNPIRSQEKVAKYIEANGDKMVIRK